MAKNPDKQQEPQPKIEELQAKIQELALENETLRLDVMVAEEATSKTRDEVVAQKQGLLKSDFRVRELTREATTSDEIKDKLRTENSQILGLLQKLYVEYRARSWKSSTEELIRNQLFRK